jgi:hypothetical protein
MVTSGVIGHIYSTSRGAGFNFAAEQQVVGLGGPACARGSAPRYLVHPEGPMRTYAKFSGLFFTVLALAQLTRLVLRWPVQVARVSIPVWISGIAFLILGSLAIWAFRTNAAPNMENSR